VRQRSSHLRLFVVAAIGLCCLSPIARAQQVKVDTDAIAIGGNVSDSTINIGVLPEQLAALIGRTAYLSEAAKNLIAELERKLDVNQRQIHAALEILGEANVPPGRLTAKLVEIAGRFKALQTTATAHPGDDPTIAAMKVDAQKAIEAGDLAKTDALLASVESEQRRVLDRLALIAAETWALRGDVAMTRLRYGEAAKHFADAAAILAPGEADEKKRLGYLAKEADALYHLGDEVGNDRALQLAVARYKRLVILRPRERVPLDWAITEENLGTALERLGERESGTTRLEEAVAAYRAALTEWTRERVPLDWARVQNNLGTTLEKLGERESGTARLEEAVAAYRAALTEWTRERTPLDWTTTQENLGIALEKLGERESGTTRLEEAVAAYRAALTEWTRERVPLDWARTEENLGTALERLGERESGTARLEEAVAAYRAALTERTRKRVLRDWAMSIGNQGVALMYLAQRKRDGPTAKTAVAQIEAARDTMWGVAQTGYAAYYEAQLAAARTIAEQILGELAGADDPANR
jgi:tetratricopeptide (TPR) repeat protein